MERTVSSFLGALTEVWVVVAPEPNPVRDLLNRWGVHLVDNPDFASGQSASLRRGISSLPAECSAAVIGVADQPFVTGELIGRLLSVWESTGVPVVAPRYAGKNGNPVVFDASTFDALRSVQGDVGGRHVLHDTPHAFVDFDDKWRGFDIDTPDDVNRAEALMAQIKYD